MPYVKSDGATIHYSTLPTGAPAAGQPVVTFVHGGGGNLYGFLCQMPFFAAQGFFAISVSVRGYGSSRLDNDDATLFAYDKLASDIIAVLDAVGAMRTALVGHSIGGYYVAAMARDAPKRLTHAVFSSTFYGLVDEVASPPWLTRLLDHPYGSAERDDLAIALRPHLPTADVARGEEAERRGNVRSRFPTVPDNFGAAFRQARPELCWLYDASNDGSTQKNALALGQRYRVLHNQSIPPSTLRASFTGPVLFTTSECDAAVHWECVSLIAEQMRRADKHGSGPTTLHWFDGPLCHAPYMEAAEQYNRTLLAFFRGGGIPRVPAFVTPPVGAAAASPCTYALMVTGTLNPPHIGHVRLGLHAARALAAEGHTVTSITYVPVHDNYMHNKAAASPGGGGAILYPMAERCELLRRLLVAESEGGGEHASLISTCRVLNYEGEHGAELLDESPGYWAKKLPDGYLKTVPTMGLLAHFAATAQAREGARVGVVFGVDNLAGMATWNAPANLLARADIVLVSRAMAEVAFPRDPTELLSSVARIETRAPVRVKYEPRGVLFGATVGTMVNPDTNGHEGVIYLLPPLRGDDEGLSSTAMRAALAVLVDTLPSPHRTLADALGDAVRQAADSPKIATCIKTLAYHGYRGASHNAHVAALLPLVEGAMRGPDALREIGEAAVARGERIGGVVVGIE